MQGACLKLTFPTYTYCPHIPRAWQSWASSGVTRVSPPLLSLVPFTHAVCFAWSTFCPPLLVSALTALVPLGVPSQTVFPPGPRPACQGDIHPSSLKSYSSSLGVRPSLVVRYSTWRAERADLILLDFCVGHWTLGPAGIRQVFVTVNCSVFLPPPGWDRALPPPETGPGLSSQS